MINKEVVVFQIEDMLSNINKENLLTYGGHIENGTAFLELMTNVLVLLKEQEPRQVKTDMYGNAYCPWCSTDRSIEMGAHRLHLGTQFCPYCGKAVKWDG